MSNLSKYLTHEFLHLHSKAEVGANGQLKATVWLGMQPRGQNACLANGRLAHAYNSSTQSQPSISALGRCRQEKETFKTSSAGGDGGLNEILPQKTQKQ